MTLSLFFYLWAIEKLDYQQYCQYLWLGGLQIRGHLVSRRIRTAYPLVGPYLVSESERDKLDVRYC